MYPPIQVEIPKPPAPINITVQTQADPVGVSLGVSGWSGSSGSSGFSGTNGKSGYSGFSGRSGLSGFSGQQGQSGYASWKQVQIVINFVTLDPDTETDLYVPLDGAVPGMGFIVSLVPSDIPLAPGVTFEFFLSTDTLAIRAYNHESDAITLDPIPAYVYLLVGTPTSP